MDYFWLNLQIIMNFRINLLKLDVSLVLPPIGERILIFILICQWNGHGNGLMTNKLLFIHSNTQKYLFRVPLLQQRQDFLHRGPITFVLRNNHCLTSNHNSMIRSVRITLLRVVPRSIFILLVDQVLIPFNHQLICIWDAKNMQTLNTQFFLFLDKHTSINSPTRWISFWTM